MSLLDLIYPKRCVGCQKLGDYLCASCFAFISFNETGFCTVCQRPSIDGLTHPVCRTKYEIDGVFSSLAYKGIVKKLAYQFKYKPYLRDLAGLLTELFYEGIIQKERFINLINEKSLFVPIPLHPKRLKSRGYNQSLILAQGLSIKLKEGFSLVPDKNTPDIPVVESLKRIIETKAQFGLSKKERLENIAGAFSFQTKFMDDLKKASAVFLVDDIVTTGATLREAAKVLKKSGIKKIYGLAMAHGG